MSTVNRENPCESVCYKIVRAFTRGFSCLDFLCNNFVNIDYIRAKKTETIYQKV